MNKPSSLPASQRRALAAALGLALLPSAARAQTDREVVRVNGTPIRESELMGRLWQRHGPQTLQEMVDELLLRQAAAEKKISAEPNEIEARLKRFKGQFPDAAALEKQLKTAGSSLDSIRTDIADQLAREKFVIKEGKITVTDDEVKKAFETHRKELGTPPQVHLRHILVKTEPEAREIIGRLKTGADFKTLAAERSLADSGKAAGGDYGFVAPGMLPPEIDKIAFSMEPGDIRAVATDRGQHILHVAAKKASAPAEFSKIKNDLRELLVTQKISSALPGLLQNLRAKADIQPQGAPGR